MERYHVSKKHELYGIILITTTRCASEDDRKTVLAVLCARGYSDEDIKNLLSSYSTRYCHIRVII